MTLQTIEVHMAKTVTMFKIETIIYGAKAHEKRSYTF